MSRAHMQSSDVWLAADLRNILRALRTLGQQSDSADYRAGCADAIAAMEIAIGVGDEPQGATPYLVRSVPRMRTLRQVIELRPAAAPVVRAEGAKGEVQP